MITDRQYVALTHFYYELKINGLEDRKVEQLFLQLAALLEVPEYAMRQAWENVLKDDAADIPF